MSTPTTFSTEDFAGEVVASRGVNLEELEPNTTLLVRTHHSLYRIVVLRGTSVLVEGGRHFADGAICRINGSGLGGSVLKLGWIGVGLRIDIAARGRCVVTSPVVEIKREFDDRALDVRPEGYHES